MKDYFMKLFLDYLNKIKLQILLMLFPTILTGMIFLLYQLPMEPILYIAVLWILTGLGTCAFGFHNYQKNIHNLQIISAFSLNFDRQFIRVMKIVFHFTIF